MMSLRKLLFSLSLLILIGTAAAAAATSSSSSSSASTTSNTASSPISTLVLCRNGELDISRCVSVPLKSQINKILRKKKRRRRRRRRRGNDNSKNNKASTGEESASSDTKLQSKYREVSRELLEFLARTARRVFRVHSAEDDDEDDVAVEMELTQLAQEQTYGAREEPQAFRAFLRDTRPFLWFYTPDGTRLTSSNARRVFTQFPFGRRGGEGEQQLVLVVCSDNNQFVFSDAALRIMAHTQKGLVEAGGGGDGGLIVVEEEEDGLLSFQVNLTRNSHDTFLAPILSGGGGGGGGGRQGNASVVRVIQKSRSPRVFVIDGLYSPSEIEYLRTVALTKGQLRPSRVKNASPSMDPSIRQSETGWVGRQMGYVDPKVFTESRLEELGAERLAAVAAVNPMTFEPLQIVRYTSGGYYHHHLDAPKQVSSGNLAESSLKSALGARQATLLVYLSGDGSLDRGGGTNFPYAAAAAAAAGEEGTGGEGKVAGDCSQGLTIPPKAGRVVLFYNTQCWSDLDTRPHIPPPPPPPPPHSSERGRDDKSTTTARLGAGVSPSSPRIWMDEMEIDNSGTGMVHVDEHSLHAGCALLSSSSSETEEKEEEKLVMNGWIHNRVGPPRRGVDRRGESDLFKRPSHEKAHSLLKDAHAAADNHQHQSQK